MNLTEILNVDFIDAQYQLWKDDPNAVSKDWRFFFQGFKMAGAREQKTVEVYEEDQAFRQSRVETLIHRYRGEASLVLGSKYIDTLRLFFYIFLGKTIYF